MAVYLNSVLRFTSSSDTVMPSAIEAEAPLPTYFIGHAGVGLLFNESENNRLVQEKLRRIGAEISALTPKPKAVVIFSGHFEAGEIHGPGVIEGIPTRVL